MPSSFTFTHTRASGEEVAATVALPAASLVSVASEIWEERSEDASLFDGIKTPAELLLAFASILCERLDTDNSAQGDADANSRSSALSILREVRSIKPEKLPFPPQTAFFLPFPFWRLLCSASLRA